MRERLAHRRLVHLLRTEGSRVLALGARQDELVKHLRERLGHRHDLHLVLDTVAILIDPVTKCGVGAPEGDAHEHVDKLVQDELGVLFGLPTIGSPLDSTCPLAGILLAEGLERLRLAVVRAALRVHARHLVLRAHGSGVGRVRLDELVAHDVKLVALGLEAHVDDKVVELVHRHLHRVLGRVLRDRSRVREEDELELLEEGLEDVVHLLLPRWPHVHVHQLDAPPAIEPLAEVLGTIVLERPSELRRLIRLRVDVRRLDDHRVGRLLPQ